MLAVTDTLAPSPHVAKAAASNNADTTPITSPLYMRKLLCQINKKIVPQMLEKRNNIKLVYQYINGKNKQKERKKLERFTIIMERLGCTCRKQ